MKRFLTKLSLFLFGFILVDYLILLLLLLSCDYFRSEEYSLAQEVPVSDFYIIGTSHANESFSPEIIKQELEKTSYNFGKARRNLMFNYYFSRFLIQQNKIPEKVILVLTYNDLREHTRPYLVSQFVEIDEKWQVFKDLLEQRHWDQIRGFFYTDLFSSSIRMMMSRSISWLKHQKREAPYFSDPNLGFAALPYSLPETEKPDYFKTYPFSYSEVQYRYLIKIIDLWLEQGVEVIMVDPPEFIGTRLSESGYQDFELLVDSIAKRKNIQFMSFNDPNDSFLSDPGNFRDGGWGRLNSHLNLHGANLFTKKFCNWMQKNAH